MLKKIFDKFSYLFLIFIIGSFFGFLHENILTAIKGIFVIRKGLIYEPLIPVYGIGLLILYLIYHNLKIKTENKFLKFSIIFLIGFLAGGLTEYICSFVQEKWFGTISWDYSEYFLNIHGRTSLFHSICWGLLSTVFYYFLLSSLERVEIYLQNKKIKLITIFILIIFSLDCFISISSCYRRYERRKNEEASNSFEVFLDKYYPDKFVDKIYNNAMNVNYGY